jgi:hypothetical protein
MWAGLALGDEHEERALGYLHDWERYAREILGDVPWSRQQRRAADEIAEAILGGRPIRVLCKGGHGTGKSHGQDSMVTWIWDVPSRRRDENGQPRGCALILTAPKAKSLEQTAYHAMLERGRAAASRGHILPGWAPRRADRYAGPSTGSVLWHEGPWRMLALTARSTAEKDVAHSAGGIHHPWLQILRLEEALGIPEEMIAAIEGLAISQRVAILAATNPTSRLGYLYGHIRARPTEWKQVSFSQLENQNVIQRREVIPGSVYHLNLEAALRSASFEDRGPASEVGVDPARLDVVYALPTLDTEDKPGPRADGVPGHPDAEPHVFRPLTSRAAGQHLGDWLEADAEGALFRVLAIEAGMMSAPPTPDRHPDQVGVDCHPSRAPWACPRWGPPARKLIDANRATPENASAAQLTAALTAALSGTVKSTLGAPQEVRWLGGDNLARGKSSADHLVELYGASPTYYFDQAAAGEIAVHLAQRGARVELVPFGDPPIHAPLQAYGRLVNRRAEMGVHLAEALNRGLAVAHYSPRLLEQMQLIGALEMAKGRAEAKKLPEKSGLGDSMDALDAAMLAGASGGTAPAVAGRFPLW